MKCKHCGVKIKTNDFDWMHMADKYAYAYCGHINIMPSMINTNKKAEPVDGILCVWNTKRKYHG